MTEPQPLDLAPIQAREQAASPGPWWNDSHEVYAGPTDNPAGSDWVGETCRVNDPVGSDADGTFIANARQDVPALIAEVLRLRAVVRVVQAELASESRAHNQTIADRDDAQSMADKLAAAIAPPDVRGEHSGMNDPWKNALDYAAGRLS